MLLMEEISGERGGTAPFVLGSLIFHNKFSGNFDTTEMRALIRGIAYFSTKRFWIYT